MQNPYRPGTAENAAWDLYQRGVFKDFATALQGVLSVNPNLQRDPAGTVARPPSVGDTPGNKPLAGAPVPGPAGGRPSDEADDDPPTLPGRPDVSVGPNGETVPPGGRQPQRDPRDGPSPNAPRSLRNPGVYARPDSGDQDQYGPSRIMNSNAPGVQSNGDDDPWSIGSFAGGTYDPMTMKVLYDRARAGDGEAAYILRQVGFFDEQNKLLFNSNDGLEQWANSRQLDRRAAAGDPSPWYHDPTNWGGEGFRDEADARAAYEADPWSQILGEGDGPTKWRRPQQALGAPPAVPQGAPPPASQGAPPVDYQSSPPGLPSAEEALGGLPGKLGGLFNPGKRFDTTDRPGSREVIGEFQPQQPDQAALVRRAVESPPPATASRPLPNGVNLTTTRQRRPEDEDESPWGRYFRG